ncbi:FAD-dependent oxidoreductase [soil metagenome]
MKTDVLVLGAGPAGLAAATVLKNEGVADVLIVDRADATGGPARKMSHKGYHGGVMRRKVTGVVYAARLSHAAESAGVRLELGASWNLVPGSPLEARSDDGRTIEARAIVLATGCRERPCRDRDAYGCARTGVITSGQLQELGSNEDGVVGRSAVVVGSEPSSLAAVRALVARKASVKALVAEGLAVSLPEALATLSPRRTPFKSGRVIEIYGRDRPEGVKILSPKDGSATRVPCDTVVFSGDWVPDVKALRDLDVDLDKGTGGPRVDAGMSTSVEGLFAAGGVVHGGASARLAEREGQVAGRSALAHLSGSHWPRGGRLTIECEGPIAWVSPGVFFPDRHKSHPPCMLGAAEGRGLALVEVTQDGHTLYRVRRRVVPGRFIPLPSVWTGSANPRGGPVRVSVRG